jgi:N6-adenosine-specific RNA methylase IME4
MSGGWQAPKSIRKNVQSRGVTEGLPILDARPIELAGFTLRARSVEVVGTPTIHQWLNAMGFAAAVCEASPYWVGDLLAYSDTRAEWQERRDALLDSTGLALETLSNYAYVARHVMPAERDVAPSFAHAQVVAPLTQPEQSQYLETARSERLTRRELIQRIKIHKRTAVLDAQATLEGMYRVIYADPPWSYRESTPWADGSHTPAEQHYPAMSMEELCQLPVAAHARPDSVLFLWVTASMVFENPGPRDIIEAWGFNAKTQYVWDKVLGRPGNYSFVKHELLIVAGRGSATPDVSIEGIRHDSVQTVRREGEHSEKPEHFRKLIEQLYPHGPKLELFARKQTPGWTCFGNDARLWAAEVGA